MNANRVSFLPDMAFSAHDPPGAFSLKTESFMALLALEVKGFLQRKRAVVGMYIMAVHALLTLPTPVIAIGVKIMMASKTVDFGRMSLVRKNHSRSLMFSEFFMIEYYFRFL